MSLIQETFYVIGIIYMSVMLLVTICVVAAILVIRRKVKKYLKLINGGKNAFTATKSGTIVFKRAKKAFNT